jgi:hypothetical protein
MARSSEKMIELAGAALRAGYNESLYKALERAGKWAEYDALSALEKSWIAGRYHDPSLTPWPLCEVGDRVVHVETGTHGVVVRDGLDGNRLRVRWDDHTETAPEPWHVEVV